MARIYDHDELKQIRCITLCRKRYWPILKCIIGPILKQKNHSNWLAAVGMHLTSIRKCIFDSFQCAVTRAHLQPKFCSLFLHLALICLSANTEVWRGKFSGLDPTVSADGVNHLEGKGIIQDSHWLIKRRQSYFVLSFRRTLAVLDKIPLQWHTLEITSKSQAKSRRKLAFSHCLATSALQSIPFVGLLTLTRNSLKNLQATKLLKKEQIIRINTWERFCFPSIRNESI